MAAVETRIEEPKIGRDKTGKITSVRVVFGPHHFVEIDLEGGRVQCAIGSTHHGIRADAAAVGGEFEQLIGELMEAHKDKSF
jgi:hypothetical protein